MKKVIAISFLFLANIVILAHTVIPHHHHDGVIVGFIENHSAVCEEHHSHNHECNHVPHSHQHNCNGSFEDCLLDDIYFRVDNNNQPLISQTNYERMDVLDLFFADFLNYTIPKDPIGLPFRQKPFIETYHSIYLFTANGLRAPPVC